jgi:hypothetical protein
MAEERDSQERKSLEMRVAELEDKLSKIYITEEELKAYQKVAGLLSGGQPGAGIHYGTQICWFPPCCVCRFPVPPCCVCRFPVPPCCVCGCACLQCFSGGEPGSGGGGFGSLGT